MAAVFPAALVLAACAGVGSDGTSGFVGASSLVVTVSPDDRKDAPVLAGEDLDGRPVSSDDFAGQVLVVNAWGSWCQPCREEAPMLQEVAAGYAGRGVRLLGVNVRDDVAPARAFERRFGTTYPSIRDEDEDLLLGFADSLPAQAIPTTWVVDAEGRLAARIMDPNLSAATLTAVVDDVLAEGA